MAFGTPGGGTGDSTDAQGKCQEEVAPGLQDSRSLASDPERGRLPRWESCGLYRGRIRGSEGAEPGVLTPPIPPAASFISQGPQRRLSRLWLR